MKRFLTVILVSTFFVAVLNVPIEVKTYEASAATCGSTSDLTCSGTGCPGTKPCQSGYPKTTANPYGCGCGPKPKPTAKPKAASVDDEIDDSVGDDSDDTDDSGGIPVSE